MLNLFVFSVGQIYVIDNCGFYCHWCELSMMAALVKMEGRLGERGQTKRNFSISEHGGGGRGGGGGGKRKQMRYNIE